MAMTFEFGREKRLRRRADFLRVQSEGLRVTTAHFVFLLARTPGFVAGSLAPARYGLVVSRKVGNAVERNRVKRRCRELVRLTPEALPPGIDAVIIARAGAPELSVGTIRGEWAGVERYFTRRLEELASGLTAATAPDRGKRRGPPAPAVAPRPPSAAPPRGAP